MTNSRPNLSATSHSSNSSGARNETPTSTSTNPPRSRQFTPLPVPASPPPDTNQDEPLPVIPTPRLRQPKDLFYPSASTTLSVPSFHPNNPNTVSPSGFVPSVTLPIAGTGQLNPNIGSTTVTYHLITKHLALLALVPTAVYLEKRGLLEYNVVFFREGVQEICDVEEEARGTRGHIRPFTSRVTSATTSPPAQALG